MFINKLPFFVSVLWCLNCSKAEFIKNIKVPTLDKILNKIVILYLCQGFTMNMAFMDREIEVLRDQLTTPDLNINVEDEHVLGAERKIRVIR